MVQNELEKIYNTFHAIRREKRRFNRENNSKYSTIEYLHFVLNYSIDESKDIYKHMKKMSFKNYGKGNI